MPFDDLPPEKGAFVERLREIESAERELSQHNRRQGHSNNGDGNRGPLSDEIPAAAVPSFLPGGLPGGAVPTVEPEQEGEGEEYVPGERRRGSTKENRRTTMSNPLSVWGN